MSESRYRAFISYCHSDAAWGDWLHRGLERFRTPSQLVSHETPFGPAPRRLTPIFRDRADLAAAPSLGAAIEAALAESLFIIVICSPGAARSPWVNEEIRRFKALHGEDRVLPLIVAGEPYASEAGDDASECFPLALRRIVGADGALTDARAEPVAADARPNGDGKKYARLKLAAGLLGVRLDDLVRRDAARRAQRSRLIAAGAAIVAAGMGGLAYEARLARNDADRQRIEAENLIEFMLTDLREKLEPVGRIDALGVVGERALDYYSRQKENALDADALGRRSRSLLLVGEIDNLRGDLDAALAAYEEAAATTAEQLRRDPNNGQRLYDHAQSVFWVGYIAWQRGDRKTAEAQFRNYLDLAERMVAIDPENADYQGELGYAYSNLGTLLLETRRWDEARAFFERSKARNKILVAEQPNDTAHRLDLAQDYSWIARAQGKAGNFVVARNSLAAELLIYDRILAAEDNQTARADWLLAKTQVAFYYVAEGRLDAAFSLLRSASEEVGALQTRDPSNTRWRRTAAVIFADYANAAIDTGRLDEAAAAIARARSSADDLLAEDATVVDWNWLLSRVETIEARLHATKREPMTARALLTDALERLGPAASQSGPGGYQVASLRARADRDLGDLLSDSQNDEAREHWTDGLAQFGDDLDRLDPFDKTLAASLLLRLERRDACLQLMEGLRAMDFRHPEFLTVEHDFTAGSR